MASSIIENFVSPVGRLVQGDLFTAQDKDQQGNLRVVKTGPNAGQPNPQFFAAVAFPKNDPHWPAFYAILERVARAGFPALFPHPSTGQTSPTGGSVNPKFTLKVIDGDGMDTNGKPNSAKEGFAGHWVVRFASQYAPKVYLTGQLQPHQQLTKERAHEAQRGFYVRVAGNCSPNDNQQNPGLFVNLNMVEVCFQGPAIQSGPSAADAFAQPPAPVALPPGATPIPTAGPAPVAPVAPAYAPPAPVAAPAPVAPVAPAPVHTAYMAPPAPPAVVPAPPTAPVVAAQPQLVPTAAAAGATIEQLIAANWTQELLVQHGMAVWQ